MTTSFCCACVGEQLRGRYSGHSSKRVQTELCVYDSRPPLPSRRLQPHQHTARKTKSVAQRHRPRDSSLLRESKKPVACVVDAASAASAASPVSSVHEYSRSFSSSCAREIALRSCLTQKSYTFSCCWSPCLGVESQNRRPCRTSIAIDGADWDNSQSCEQRSKAPACNVSCDEGPRVLMDRRNR
eukprot:SAG31_NODE_17709_length_660_cov_1.311943_2_plen_185_part_00